MEVSWYFSDKTECNVVVFYVSFLLREMIAALVFMALIALTNYIMIFFSCHGLKVYGAWLNKYQNRDLWLIRVLVSQRETTLID